MNIHRSRGTGASVVAAGVLTIPLLACANGFQISEQNASGLGSVYAGQAAVALDASAIFFNPAELTRLTARHQAVFGGAYIKPSSTFNDGGSCTPYLGTDAGTTTCPAGPSGNLGHTAGGSGSPITGGKFVPHAYSAWSLSPTMWLGLGISAPFGLSNDHDQGWVGRFQAIESRTSAININPTIAWQPENLPASFGVGLDAQRLTAKLSNAVSYTAIALSTQSPALIAAVPPGSQGVATVEGSDWGWGWNAGVDLDLGRALKLDRALHLGVAYRAPIRHTLEGTVGFTGRPAALAGVPPLADGPVTAKVKLPDTLSVAVAWDAARDVTLLADWTRTGWSSIRDLTVVRSDSSTLSNTAFNFRNTHRVAVGASWQVSDSWTLRTGYARESSAVTDAYRNSRLPDAARNYFGVGARWVVPAAFMKGLTLDLGAALSRYDKAPIAQPNQETATSVPQGSLVGVVDTHALIVGTQLSWSF